jgi:hypothetical protein
MHKRKYLKSQTKTVKGTFDCCLRISTFLPGYTNLFYLPQYILVFTQKLLKWKFSTVSAKLWEKPFFQALCKRITVYNKVYDYVLLYINAMTIVFQFQNGGLIKSA